MKEIKTTLPNSASKSVGVTVYRRVNMRYSTAVDIDVPTGLDVNGEKEFIKDYVLENQYDLDVIEFGDPTYDSWEDDVTYIEAQYNNGIQDCEKRVIFIRFYL